MAADDSFKKPGAIPFKWEIRPGVPKVQQQPHLQSSYDHHRPLPLQPQLHKQQHSDLDPSFPSTPQKLRPPPAGLYFQPPPELRTGSFRSTTRTRSESYRFDSHILGRPEVVSTGCLPTPLLRRKHNKKKLHKPKPGYESEPDYNSDIEILSRWSMSTRKSLSPFRDSHSSSSFSSYQCSPLPVGDAEWAGFGLF
ncbi:unnamed protein product [Ilex paraguariensis]|uniref:Uncharacterized protein n=1 Tax=Ilex paraguariensis TaxID=185542 RepID=A0ABC8TP92_9AQUA